MQPKLRKQQKGSLGKNILNAIRLGAESLGKISEPNLVCGVSQLPSTVKSPLYLYIIWINSTSFCFAGITLIIDQKMMWVEEGKNEIKEVTYCCLMIKATELSSTRKTSEDAQHAD